MRLSMATRALEVSDGIRGQGGGGTTESFEQTPRCLGMMIMLLPG